MKNARIHLIYLTIIGFLTYQYWAKTQVLNEVVGSIEQFDTLLKQNNKNVQESAYQIIGKIGSETQIYPNYTNINFFNNNKTAFLKSQNMIDWLEKERKAFIDSDKKDSSRLVDNILKRDGNRYFTDMKIKEFKDSLVSFQVVLGNVSDTFARKNLENKSFIKKLIDDEYYWKQLGKSSFSEILTQITSIQNRIGLDAFDFFNYKYGLIASHAIIEDYFHVAIAPKKAAIIEGETFEMYTYLAQYSTYSGNDVTFIVNGQMLPHPNGVAHFSTDNQSVGLKKIKVEALIRNPLTGQTTTEHSEFEYEVLPKCSRDCK